MKQSNFWLRVAGLAGFLAVALGAFGAHALKDVLVDQKLSWWQTASHYHLIHAVAMALPQARSLRRAPAALFFAWGILIFSGSLYAMALTGMTWLGAVTPLGGLMFLSGWLRLAFSQSTDNES